MKKTLTLMIAALALSLPAEGKTSRIKKVGDFPEFLALSPDGRMAYVTSFGTGELIAVDVGKRVVSRRVVVGSAPLGLAVTADGKSAYIACRDSGTVAVVDLGSFRVEANIVVGGAPNAVALGAKGYRAYVTNFGRTREGVLHIVDTRDRSVLASVKMGLSPIALTVSPIDEMVYVANGGSNELWVVAPERQAVVARIAVGEAPDGVAITPDGSRVFVTNSRSNDLTVVDTKSRSALVSVPVGKSPFGVDVSPDGRRVFVVNSGAKTVSILPVDLSLLSPKTVQIDKGCIDVKVMPNNRTLVIVSEQTHSLLIAEAP